MKYLFVGGPLDGKWSATDGRPYWRAHETIDPKPAELWEGVSVEPSEILFRTVEYHSLKFRENESEFLIYVTKPFDKGGVFKRLMECYRPQLESEGK